MVLKTVIMLYFSPTGFLPYGRAADDMQGSAGDDLLSAKIENPVGLTCGKSLFHSIYVGIPDIKWCSSMWYALIYIGIP